MYRILVELMFETRLSTTKAAQQKEI